MEKKYRLLHNIGTEKHSNYNTREEVLACNDTLTFDGIYSNVYQNRDILKGKEIILFVMGDYINGDNQFDLKNVPKFETYTGWEEILDLVINFKAELGWHTWSHPDLTTLTKEEIMKEITPPFPMESFAYPYGKYNELVKQCVKEAGYKRAFSVNQTDGTQWTIPRPYLNH